MAIQYKTALYHLLAWLVYLLIIGLSADRVDADFILKSISGFLPVIAVFYLNTQLVFPRFIPSKKYVALTFAMLLVIVLCVGIRAVFIQFYLDMLPPFDVIMFWVQFRTNFLFAGISLAIWYAKSNYENEKKYQILKNEVAEAKLALLKNQINPHFLYNTLSLIYTKAIPLSDDLATIISKLSDMLRYSLEETETNGRVPLSKEVKYLDDYIAIQQARFGEKLAIDFQIKGAISDKTIAPLLLITFVENAFKHGKMDDPAAPLKILISAEKKETLFEITNSKQVGKKDISSGIGLENIRKRLEILYPKRHELRIENPPDSFKISLKIWDEN